ncbi:MAG: Phosphatidylserine decarboxylase proenzyme [bacterium]|nr:Phosphatidylserine decarboxylase proenzyme [bacterium]
MSDQHDRVFPRRPPEFARDGRVTRIERLADLARLNRWFLRRPPIRIEPSEGDIISPAQARIQTLAPIDPSGWIEEKSVFGQPRRIQIREILRDDSLAESFVGGETIKLYLAPWDLHFLLFPVPGIVSRYEYRSGWAVPLLFMRSGDVLNQRLCVRIETDWGFPVGVVLIGSWMVNGIHHAFQEGARYDRGADLGHFKIGSSVVMAFPRGKVRWLKDPGEKVRLGETIAKLV